MKRFILITCAALSLGAFAAPVSAQEATPTWSCATPATPTTDHGGHAGTDHGSDHAEALPFDQLYIDMMVPHHDAVIALSQAALPTLTDPALIGMAENIIANQSSENAMMLEWRVDWYGDGTVLTDGNTMNQMLEAMPVGSMEDMMFQMDPHAQVTAFCAAPDADLAFAEMTLAHHQMAVDASVIAIEAGEHPELVAFAEEVIAAQQAEIDVINAFLAGREATPEG